MKIFVVGHRPAHSKKANDFIKTLDLGCGGAFVRFSEAVEISFDKDISKQQSGKVIDALKKAYESDGCVNVFAQELND